MNENKNIQPLSHDFNFDYAYYDGGHPLLKAALADGFVSWNKYIKALRDQSKNDSIIIQNLQCSNLDFGQYDLTNMTISQGTFVDCNFNNSHASSLYLLDTTLKNSQLNNLAFNHNSIISQTTMLKINDCKIINTSIGISDKIFNFSITHSQITNSNIQQINATHFNLSHNIFTNCVFDILNFEKYTGRQNTFTRCTNAERLN